jgi:hypothetical protein
MEEMIKGGRASIADSFKVLSGNEGLWKQFLSCSEMEIPIVTKRIIFEQLISKTFHARIGVVTVFYNEVFTWHYAKNASGQSLQSEIQAKTKSSSELQSSGAKRKLLATQKKVSSVK